MNKSRPLSPSQLIFILYTFFLFTQYLQGYNYENSQSDIQYVFVDPDFLGYIENTYRNIINNMLLPKHQYLDVQECVLSQLLLVGAVYAPNNYLYFFTYILDTAS